MRGGSEGGRFEETGVSGEERQSVGGRRQRSLGKSYPDFNHFQSEMCRQAGIFNGGDGFFNGGEIALRPVFFCEAAIALTFP